MQGAAQGRLEEGGSRCKGQQGGESMGWRGQREGREKAK